MAEIIKVSEEVMIIKGFMNAEESRKKADLALAEKERAFKEAKELALKKLMEKDFVRDVLERAIFSIECAVKRGDRQACTSGYGDTSHPLRCWEIQIELLSWNLLPNRLFQFLKARGIDVKQSGIFLLREFISQLIFSGKN